ncbi:IS481 family transposase, partial [Mannheimia haemolytica]|nr:IS481 family transposase [Mannheimia haemolytica]
LERKKEDEIACGEIETVHPGYLGSQDTFYVIYQVAFRKKIYTDLTTLQADLDEWLMYYNHHRTHQGKMCCGRTPMATLLDGKRIWVEKNLSSN